MARVHNPVWQLYVGKPDEDVTLKEETNRKGKAYADMVLRSRQH